MNAKLISLIAVIILALFVILQNTHETEIYFLFWNFKMSAIILVLFTLLIGAVGGYIFAKMTQPKE